MDVLILLMTWLLGFGQPVNVVQPAVLRGGQTPPILCTIDDPTCPSRRMCLSHSTGRRQKCRK